MVRQHSKLRILEAVLALVACFFSASPAAACSPALPDPWFIELITFNTRQLPAGITITPIPTNSFPGFQLRNPSQTPLIIPPTLANQPTIKVVANEWFEQRDGSWASVTEEMGNTTVRHAAQPQLDYPQPQFVSVRPATVPLPTPQQSEVRLIYGDHPVILPITVHYELNPAYRPESFAQYQAGVAACSQRRVVPLLFCISVMAVGMGVVIGGVLIKRRAQRTQSNDH